jgi:threonine/homoserine/homoserine lactone efflux protein
MNTINNCGTGLKRDWAFRIACALLFIASAARMIYGERSMSSGMGMPGGWTMSMYRPFPWVFISSPISLPSKTRGRILEPGALNFFLGWTLVGWVVALVWAMSKDANVGQPPPPVILNAYVPPLAPSAQKKCPDCADRRS